MRKGIAIVEMLAVIVVVAMLSVAFAALTRPLLVEIPRANRVMETNTIVLNMLSHMRDDVQAAVRLPDSFEGRSSDGNDLFIELPDGVICRYTLEDGKVIKTVSKAGKAVSTEIWPVPKAKITWHRWQRQGRPYAVEVSSHIEYKQGTRVETKLANSHVYFVGPSMEAVREK